MTSVRAWTARVGALAATVGLAGGWAAAAPAHSPPGHHAPCPPRAPSAGASTGSAAAKKLVPAGADQVALCRYQFSGLKADAFRTGLRAIRSLTHEYNALKPLPPSTSYPRRCPKDDGVVVEAIFGYPDGSPVTVLLEVTGCQLVGNGQIERWARPPPGPKLIRRLMRQTGCPAKGGGPACFTFR